MWAIAEMFWRSQKGIDELDKGNSWRNGKGYETIYGWDLFRSEMEEHQIPGAKRDLDY